MKGSERWDSFTDEVWGKKGTDPRSGKVLLECAANFGLNPTPQIYPLGVASGT